MQSRSSSRTARCIQFALCFPGLSDGGAGAQKSYRSHRQKCAGDPRAVGARAPRGTRTPTLTRHSPGQTRLLPLPVNTQTRRDKRRNASRHPPCPSAFTPPPASAPLIPQRTHRLSQPPPQPRPAAVRDRGPHTHLSCRSHTRSRRAERRLRRDRERVGPGRTGPGRPVSRGTHRGEGGRTAWRRDTLPGAKGGAAQPSRRPHRAAPPQRCVAAAAAPALNLSRGAWALGRRGRPGWERGREQASAGRPQLWAQPGSVRQVLPFRPRRASHSASVCSGGAGGCAPRSCRDAAPLLLPTAKPRPGRLAPCPAPCSAHLQPAFAVCPSKSALVTLRVPVTCVF